LTPIANYVRTRSPPRIWFVIWYITYSVLPICIFIYIHIYTYSIYIIIHIVACTSKQVLTSASAASSMISQQCIYDKCRISHQTHLTSFKTWTYSSQISQQIALCKMLHYWIFWCLALPDTAPIVAKMQINENGKLLSL
jgi:hypothetical protein